MRCVWWALHRRLRLDDGHLEGAHVSAVNKRLYNIRYGGRVDLPGIDRAAINSNRKGNRDRDTQQSLCEGCKARDKFSSRICHDEAIQ